MIDLIIAIFGTRDYESLSEKSKETLFLVSSYIGRKGYILRTGACKGVDQKATEVCLENGGRVELYLPYHSYEKNWIQSISLKYKNSSLKIIIYNPSIHRKWTESVIKYHPNPNIMMKPTDTCFHARNYGIVHACDLAIVLPHPHREGGTGQGMRIARALDIPLYNINDEKDVELLRISVNK